MRRLAMAARILADLGLPKAQQNERSALVLLALAGLGSVTPWRNATASLQRTVDLMEFIRERHGKDYKPNSRETIRRQTLHQFEQAHVVERNPDDLDRATNSGKTVYRLTADALGVIQSCGSRGYDPRVAQFKRTHGALSERYASPRALRQIRLTLPSGRSVDLSPGRHNRLQVQIVNEFGPRFAPGSQLLYLGDTAKKSLVLEHERLAELGIALTAHDKLPDVILFDVRRGWLLLVEAVTSHGPVSSKRHAELEKVLKGAKPGRVYVTAFPTAAEFRKHAAVVAWETEVWIAEQPDHMIHFNGKRFLGPYGPSK